ncbi:DNA polymerase theta, partial [Pseudolycoriella hygida]
TLQELEKEAGLQPVKISTPNRASSATSSINSDVDIIEESPTNHSSVYSLRERTKAKHFNKSKTKNKRMKSRSCEQLTTTEKVEANNTLSQFFRSEYEFSGDILQILPETRSTKNEKLEIEKTKEKVVDNESDMFDDWIVPQNVESKPLGEANGKENISSANIVWDDSYDFNDVDLSLCKENNIMELNLKVDDQVALGLDNVTFTQNFMNEASFENDLNTNKDSNSIATSKFIEEEMESCKNSFTNEVLTENGRQSPNVRSGHLSSLNLNISESSFTLNYSDSLTDSTMENDDKQMITEDVIEKSQPLKHLNSIDSWGLPTSIVREYHRKNIFNMFDWQRECLSNPKVLLKNANLVYCAPTSAGKTLVSEILMIKNVLEKQKKVLIILPFVSVVREKMNYL